MGGLSFPDLGGSGLGLGFPNLVHALGEGGI